MYDAQIEAAITADETTRQRIIRDLASQPTQILSAITTGHQSKERWATLMRIISAIGYPANAEILPWVVERVDRNSPAWQETVIAIRAIPAAVIASYLIGILWPRKPITPAWGYDAESICVLLVELGHEYARLCAPVITHLLNLTIAPEILDPSFLLDVLALVVPDVEAYILPSLLAVIDGSADNELKSQAMGLAFQYDSTARALYGFAVKTQ